MTNDEARRVADSLHGSGYNVPYPITDEWLEEAYKSGMTKKEDLVNYAFYIGACRNAQIAMWSESKGCFVHLRVKFGSIFSEEIKYPTDEESRFDVFVPVKQIFSDEND